jgi:hypothetical protein
LLLVIVPLTVGATTILVVAANYYCHLCWSISVFYWAINFRACDNIRITGNRFQVCSVMPTEQYTIDVMSQILPQERHLRLESHKYQHSKRIYIRSHRHCVDAIPVLHSFRRIRTIRQHSTLRIHTSVYIRHHDRRSTRQHRASRTDRIRPVFVLCLH